MIAVSAVVWKLKSVNTITAIVSTRIYPGKAPQDATLPYLVVDNPPGQANLGGKSTGQGSFRKTPVVVYCYSDKSTGGITQAGTIAAIVDSSLSPQSGVTGSVQWNGISVDHCTTTDVFMHIENPQEAEEVGWRAMCVAVDVFHTVC